MTEPVTIEFPCADYTIRVIAARSSGTRDEVVDIVRNHDTSFREESVSVRPSREGNYCSVRLAILATGETQLKALHLELMAHPLVKMVL